MIAANLRLAWILALMPLAAFAFGVFYWTAERFPGNAAQVVCILETSFAAGVVFAVWRKFVRWNRLRSLGTLGLTAALLVHVILWIPFWPMGCVENELRGSQSLVFYGVWAAACALLWWWPLSPRAPRAAAPEKTGEAPMFPGTARMALGFALAPLLPGLFFFAHFAGQYFLEGTGNGITWGAYEVCAAVAITVWLLAWRRAVVWTRKRVLTTLFLAVLLLASPASVFLPEGGGLFTKPQDELWDCVRYIFPLLMWAVWIAGTSISWRYNPAELERRLQKLSFDAHKMLICPACGYNLQGLREIRCPECGWSGTVDTLVAHGLPGAAEAV